MLGFKIVCTVDPFIRNVQPAFLAHLGASSNNRKLFTIETRMKYKILGSAWTVLSFLPRNIALVTRFLPLNHLWGKVPLYLIWAPLSPVSLLLPLKGMRWLGFLGSKPQKPILGNKKELLKGHIKSAGDG